MFVVKDELIEITETKKIRNKLDLFPIKFKIARVIKGYSQKELSELAGGTRKTIVLIENGKNNRISQKTFIRLSNWVACVTW